MQRGAAGQAQARTAWPESGDPSSSPFSSSWVASILRWPGGKLAGSSRSGQPRRAAPLGPATTGSIGEGRLPTIAAHHPSDGHFARVLAEETHRTVTNGHVGPAGMEGVDAV